MIISHIIGGLGNQMFQYAAGRALALERGQSLWLDVSSFSGYELHQGFELQRIFDIPAEIAGEAEVCSILGWQVSPGIRRIVRRSGMAAFRRKGLIVEPHFHYWPEIKNVPRDCYLTGYWQSERYFADVAHTIRVDFTFRQLLSHRNLEISQEIGAGNAVSLHIRRGDYASNAKTKATHGVCPLTYYETAVRYIAERDKAPHIFIFSDDIAWVKDNLKMDFPCQYIDHNHGMESYKDMHLMSLCRHHIIANSSFSWWGAWLNPDVGKIVVAPKKWLANENKVEDLFPQGWVTL